MLAMYLKYHKAGLTPTTPVTSIAISPVKMSIDMASIFLTRHKRLWVSIEIVFGSQLTRKDDNVINIF
jgi:hypothetical protein